MTSRQAILSLLSLGIFPATVGLFYLGGSYLETHDTAPEDRKSPPINSVASNPAPLANSSAPSPSQDILLLRQAFQLVQEKQLDAALEKVSSAIEIAPKNPDAFILRGSIYIKQNLWAQAENDFQSALQLDNKHVQIKFDLAEIKFLQKKYDDARAGFVALQGDPEMGDLATYKVFLCDLLGGHDDDAAREWAAFNETGMNASYYFANAAWFFYRHQTEEARGWLKSAATIYPPNKFREYAASLVTLGYLSLPPPQH
jgi:Tfp pilus assembly protein PilF